jgi:hypothetical protein
MRFALATCRDLAEPDDDEAPLLDALRARGHDAQPLAWDDSAAEPAEFDVVVLRATWNYHIHPEAFLAWAEGVTRVARLVNPLSVVRWNLHKRYLAELAAAGVPVVPTLWFERGARASLHEILDRTGWDEIVVKPAISAASFETHRFTRGDADEADAFLRRLCLARDVMVQPYMRAVDEAGERSLVWIDGEVTHAVGKSPRFAGGEERVSRATEASPEERQIVETALARFTVQLTYARVDFMPGPDGSPLVSELELIEPSLFFPLCQRALDRFADALVRDAAG